MFIPPSALQSNDLFITKIDSPEETSPCSITEFVSLPTTPSPESEPECIQVDHHPNPTPSPSQQSSQNSSLRRGPGRPPKLANGADHVSSNSNTYRRIRRQYHNESAMRSRAKLNLLVDQLWNEVPDVEKSKVVNVNAAIVSRSEKIQAALLYIRKLSAAI